jgi:eukaryotic-like serine/threonine-protein kinase
MQPPVQIGAVVDDKYRIDAFLGSGAMSIVALAFHLELEQQVAIKFLHAQGFDQDQTAQRFKREARAGARIHSEHVVRVFDVGTLADGCPYIVMEHLKGNDLGRELAERGRLPASEVVGYMLEACEALAEAHAVGVVHRDLKPENLFLAERSDGGRIVKLLDFGISKSMMGNSLTDLALTRTATFMGSPLYMSPEQMRSSRHVDARSDIWSLGAIFYEMLTGQLPFIAESIPELCLAVIGNEPKPPRELSPELPEGLDKVVLRCLEKDRDRRYSSVAELALELAPYAPQQASSPERTARILALQTVVIPLGVEEPTRTPRRSIVVPPTSLPRSDSLVPTSRKGAEATTLSSRPAPRYAPVWVAAAVVLAAALWGLAQTATSSTEPQVASQPPGMLVAAEPTRPEPVAASADIAPVVAAPPEPLATPLPSLATAPASPAVPSLPAKPQRALRPSPRVATSAAPESPRPQASATPGNAWDSSAFGGRY